MKWSWLELFGGGCFALLFLVIVGMSVLEGRLFTMRRPYELASPRARKPKKKRRESRTKRRAL
jgi:hypothetical protein